MKLKGNIWYEAYTMKGTFQVSEFYILKSQPRPVAINVTQGFQAWSRTHDTANLMQRDANWAMPKAVIEILAMSAIFS